jgi:hypothetical protein
LTVILAPRMPNTTTSSSSSSTCVGHDAIASMPVCQSVDADETPVQLQLVSSLCPSLQQPTSLQHNPTEVPIVTLGSDLTWTIDSIAAADSGGSCMSR